MVRSVYSILILLAFISPFLSTPVYSQDDRFYRVRPKIEPRDLSKVDFGPLEETLKAELAEKKAPGAAVAIIDGDKVIYSKGFGLANIETGTPVTTATLFQTGSVTKPFTAAMILGMSKDGLLTFNEPIARYVNGLAPAIGRVTLADLLTHTSGILDEPDEFGPHDEGLMGPYIRSWKDDYVLFPHDTLFSYSNAGYALAGFTASEVAGKPYTVLMKERLFDPLGMKTATFEPTVAMTYPLAVGHQIKDGKATVVRPLPHDARLYPAGTTYVSINDLARFATAFLNGGVIEGKQAISPQVIDEMSKQRKAVEVDNATGYGYGLFTDNSFELLKSVWHDGSMTGYTASMLLFPDYKIGIVILCNGDNVVLQKTQDHARRITLPSFQGNGEISPSQVMLEPSEMQKYTGKYTQPKRFDIEVYIRDGQMYIKEFGLEMPLTHLQYNNFSFRLPKAPRPVKIYIQPDNGTSFPFLQQYVWSFRKVK
jgi:CubicO group peptidase (beta-lactamase class C family)